MKNLSISVFICVLVSYQAISQTQKTKTPVKQKPSCVGADIIPCTNHSDSQNCERFSFQASIYDDSQLADFTSSYGKGYRFESTVSIGNFVVAEDSTHVNAKKGDLIIAAERLLTSSEKNFNCVGIMTSKVNEIEYIVKPLSQINLSFAAICKIQKTIHVLEEDTFNILIVQARPINDSKNHLFFTVDDNGVYLNGKKIERFVLLKE